MDERHAAIAAYLRRHNALVRPDPLPKAWLEAPRSRARCARCQAPIVAEDDLPVLGTLLRAWRCLACYLLHEAA